MLVMQRGIAILTGLMSPRVWSRAAAGAEYAELKFRTASTGLIFSSSSMAQKFGGALGGSAVMWLLAGVGYVSDPAVLTKGDVIQPAEALDTLRMLMSFIPAGVALLAMVVVYFYPLTTKKINNINNELKRIRQTN